MRTTEHALSSSDHRLALWLVASVTWWGCAGTATTTVEPPPSNETPELETSEPEEVSPEDTFELTRCTDEESPGAEIILLASSNIYTTPDDVEVSASVCNPAGTTLTLSPSRLFITDDQGAEVHTVEEPFPVESPTMSSTGVSWSLTPVHGIPPSTPPGRYRAVLTMGELTSNAIELELAVGPRRRQLLMLAPLHDAPGSPCTCRRDMALFVRNTTGRRLDIGDLYQALTLHVDGRRGPLKLLLWAGGTTLEPSHSWSATLSLDDFDVALGSGSHLVHVESRGHVSNTLRVIVP